LNRIVGNATENTKRVTATSRRSGMSARHGSQPAAVLRGRVAASGVYNAVPPQALRSNVRGAPRVLPPATRVPYRVRYRKRRPYSSDVVYIPRRLQIATGSACVVWYSMDANAQPGGTAVVAVSETSSGNVVRSQQRCGVLWYGNVMNPQRSSALSGVHETRKQPHHVKHKTSNDNETRCQTLSP